MALGRSGHEGLILNFEEDKGDKGDGDDVDEVGDDAWGGGGSLGSISLFLKLFL